MMMSAKTKPGESGQGNGNSNAEVELASFSKVQKLARLLLMLNSENATQILKQLDEQELEVVSSEMLKVESINAEVQELILQEFSPVALDAATAIPGGINRIQRLLDQSVGLLRASDIIGRVSPLRAPVAAMQQIVDMEPRSLFNLVRHEQVQTIALVASYLPDEKASALLSLMRPELREQVVERLATLAPTSIEVLESVAEALQAKAGAGRARGLNQTGGVKAAARILNALPKDVSKTVLIGLRERNRELADAISQKMFTFEELEQLDAKSLQKIMGVVDVQTLAVALKTAQESLKTKLLSCISKRAAQNVLEEISFMGPRKLSEVEAARAAIIEIVKNLDAEGEIELDTTRQGSRH
ncbi:MAG: flagellar motor switch protein FliG [Limisphaerales bacterium]